MKFPTSSSSITMPSPVSNQTITAVEASATTTTLTQVTNTVLVTTDQNQAAGPNTKKPETENVASSLTTTAGNFFRKYTSTASPAPPSQAPPTSVEMNVLKTPSEVVAHEVSEAAAANKNVPATSAKAKVVSNKPSKPLKSRKISRAPPPPTTPNNSTPATSKGKKSMTSPNRAVVQRPTLTHSFHTDATEVQQMETVLLKLLDDFNSGKLRAFGQSCSMEQMSSIRDQQESLAKLHFDIGARQDPSAPLSEEGLRAANDNLDRLMARLEKLSDDIGQLHPASSTKNSPSSHPTEPTSLEQPKLDR